MSVNAVPDELLALQRMAHWERSAPDRVVLTQPMGAGALREFTWRQLLDQARRMAAYLQSQGIGHGDRVALLSPTRSARSCSTARRGCCSSASSTAGTR